MFSDSETFTMERPTKLTEAQEEQFFKDMARKIIEDGHSRDDIEEIIEDLKKLSLSDSGFEMAKELEDRYCAYDIDSSFIEFLEGFGYGKGSRIKENVIAWVKAHDIKPKLKKGDKLKVNTCISFTYKPGNEIFITGIQPETANYTVWEDMDRNGGYLFAYEQIENNCEIIK